MNKQDIYTLCTLIPSMDDYSGHNMYLCCISSYISHSCCTRNQTSAKLSIVSSFIAKYTFNFFSAVIAFLQSSGNSLSNISTIFISFSTLVTSGVGGVCYAGITRLSRSALTRRFLLSLSFHCSTSDSWSFKASFLLQVV